MQRNPPLIFTPQAHLQQRPAIPSAVIENERDRAIHAKDLLIQQMATKQSELERRNAQLQEEVRIKNQRYESPVKMQRFVPIQTQVSLSPARLIQPLVQPSLHPDKDRVIFSLNQQIKESQSSEAKLRLRVQELEKHINDLLESNQMHKTKEFEAFNEKYSVLEQENQSLLFKIQSLQMERDKYHQLVDVLRIDTDTIKQDNEKLSRAYFELKQMVESPPQNHQQQALHEEEIRQFKRIVDDLRFELDSSKRKMQMQIEETESIKMKVRSNERSREEEQQQYQKRVQELEFELSGTSFEEINSLRRRLHEVEEALRLADNLNQDMVEKLDQYARESINVQYHHDIQVNYKRELDELCIETDQLRKKMVQNDKFQEKFVLLCSENDRLHEVIAQMQQEVQRAKQRQITFANMMSYQQEDVRFQIENEIEQRLSQQLYEGRAYTERLIIQIKELEHRLGLCEEDKEILQKRLHNLQQDSTFTIEENYNKALATISKYEIQIKQLLAERSQVVHNYQDRYYEQSGRKFEYEPLYRTPSDYAYKRPVQNEHRRSQFLGSENERNNVVINDRMVRQW